ncbi:MAG: amidohydrolase family protein [Oscillibacter sp.]|nr:amidohydrolase family protein [Oscillibacter sp.]
MKLLLKHCDILAAGGAGFRCLENAYLGVDGDTIDYIGTEKPRAAYDREKDLSGRLLLPGLINCHGHSPMVLLRGVGSDLSLQEWLFGKIMPIEDKLTAEDIRLGNQLALLEMISTGTTSYSDMYFEPQTAVENALACGIKANISRPVQRRYRKTWHRQACFRARIRH